MCVVERDRRPGCALSRLFLPSGSGFVEQVAALQPEVVAIDIVLPLMDGIEAAKLIRERHPQCHVVLVSGSIFQERGEDASGAVREAGAASYVLKSRAALDLAEAVAAAATSPSS